MFGTAHCSMRRGHWNGLGLVLRAFLGESHTEVAGGARLDTLRVHLSAVAIAVEAHHRGSACLESAQHALENLQEPGAPPPAR